MRVARALCTVLTCGPVLAAGMDDIARACRAPELAPATILGDLTSAGWMRERAAPDVPVASLIEGHDWGGGSPFDGAEIPAVRNFILAEIATGNAILLLAGEEVGLLMIRDVEVGRVLDCMYSGPQDPRTDQIFGTMPPETLPGDVLAARQRSDLAFGSTEAGSVTEIVSRNPAAILPDGYSARRTYPGAS